MDYIIVNPGRKVYIRLNEFGSPETCTKHSMQRFEYSKAKNILDNLPKTMKKFHFRVEAVPEIVTIKDERSLKSDVQKNKTEKKVLENHTYTTPDSVLNWLERVKSCNNLAKDANKRKEELVHLLSDVDKELSNCLHRIELEPNKNGCEGFKAYKQTKIILEKRRIIKDEFSVVSSILDSNLSSIASDRIEKIVNGLSNRKFTIREMEDETVITY